MGAPPGSHAHRHPGSQCASLLSVREDPAISGAGPCNLAAKDEIYSEHNSLLAKEFGTEEIKGIRFRTGAILVEQSLLLSNIHPAKGSEPLILKKLASVFLTALNDPEIRDNISLVLVSTRLPIGPDWKANKEMRAGMQERAGLILSSLFALEPKLEKNYGAYFAATALSVSAGVKEPDWIEFRIVPTERLHIDVLMRLGKYAQ